MLRNLHHALWQSVVSLFQKRRVCAYLLGTPYNDDTTKHFLSFENRNTEEPQSQCFKLLSCLKFLYCVDCPCMSQAKLNN